MSSTSPSKSDCYPVTVSDRWNVNSGRPNGGYLVSLCSRTLGDALGGLQPLALSAHFMRPAEPGDATVETDVVPTGGNHVSGSARLLQDGRERVRVLGTFVRSMREDGPVHVFADPPALPEPDRCVDPLAVGAIPLATICDRVDYRYAALPGWRRGRPSGDPVSMFWMRLASGHVPDATALSLLADAGAAAVMELGAAGSLTLSMAVHIRGRAASEWVACRAATRFVSGGYHEEDVELWDRHGTFLAQARQLALWQE